MKTRVISAVVLLPLLLVVVLAAPKIWTCILFAAMAAVASYEILAGTGVVKNIRLCLYSSAVGFWCVLWCGLSIHYAWLLLAVLLFWVALFVEMMVSEMKLSFTKTTMCFTAGLVLPMLLGAVIRIYKGESGRFLVLIPFALAFLSDSGAYFAGLKFGKRKLAPVISPKKTVEGVVGGAVAAVTGMLLYCAVLDICFQFEVNYLYSFIYGVLGCAAGVFGDLSFSVIKRQTGIKDYGKLIPGHGGILDRFDSMILIAPIMEILLLLIPLAVR